MKWFNILRDRLRALRQRETVIGDIDREMRAHVELQTEENIKAGMSPEEAREKAMRSFGNVNRAVDAAYDVKGGGLLETLSQDIRYGVRMLAKHKAFTSVAVVTLALGIGANTAIFSVVNELLLRPLPYRDAERIVTLWEVSPEGRRQNTTSRANFRAWRDQSTSYRVHGSVLGSTLQSHRRLANLKNFQSSLRRPIFLRCWESIRFLAAHSCPKMSRAGKPPVAVLSYGLWQRRFGGQSNVDRSNDNAQWHLSSP